MQLNVKKIESRIQKLQEIRRIAADPELVSMLLEFIVTDDDHNEDVAPKPHSAVSGASPDDIDIVERVLSGKDSAGNGSWVNKRA
ncbi:MAG TPA: hypothetical protein VMJ75_01150 [Candidatus Acidoferrales bacterium]|nr:hypothetical protein [Candidatus Acidoferrales bacterium]